jgi:hypothetical protein
VGDGNTSGGFFAETGDGVGVGVSTQATARTIAPKPTSKVNASTNTIIRVGVDPLEKSGGSPRSNEENRFIINDYIIFFSYRKAIIRIELRLKCAFSPPA